MTALIAADLAATPLFASLSPDELQEAAQLFTIRCYPKNAIVATEGDRLDMFNIVLSGSVQALWRDEAGHQLELGLEPVGSTPDELARREAEETARWAPVVKASGFRADE
jgi:hypothetical protein